MVYSLGKPAIQKFLDLERYSSLDSHYRKPPAIDRNNAADFTITGISLENVSVSYSQDTSVSVLSGISKQFRSHSLILVKGKNGIGKSTLMYVIMGVVPVSGGSLDDSSKKIFIDKVLELKKTAMIFIVTHDAMFDKIADEIIDLDVIKKWKAKNGYLQLP